MLRFDAGTFLTRVRERLGWPLLSLIAGALVILLAIAFTPGERTMAAPRPETPAEHKAEPKPDTPAMGEVSTDPPKKPSPAIPKKTRRR